MQSNKTKEQAEDDVKNIIWPKDCLADKAAQNAAYKFVVYLTLHFKIVEWLNGRPGKDTFIGMPHHYHIGNGDILSFLPHWAFFSINGFNFNLPKDFNSCNEYEYERMIQNTIRKIDEFQKAFNALSYTLNQ